jgi:hypothetical protein
MGFSDILKLPTQIGFIKNPKIPFRVGKSFF